ncbi:MAG TPA: hypothetical protein VGG91_10390 [Myxococcaceae bacterium]
MRPWILVVLVLASAARGQAVPTVKSLGPQPPRNVLYVGNSLFYFNNGLPNMVWELVQRALPGADHDSRLVTISGAALSWHDLDGYLRPIDGFSIQADGRLVFHKARPFDAVVMADCSQCPIHSQLKAQFHEFARKDAEIAVRHGAKPVLFMTWAYRDRPTMTRQLAEEYTLAGNETGALVIPAGLAFAASIAADPGIDLYDPDGRHPSPAGTYLAACTVLASLYSKTPVGNSYRAALDAKTALALQRTAAETVQRFLAR